MYVFKSKLFLNLTKVQKSSLLNYLKIYVKKNLDTNPDEIFYSFIDEQTYYNEISNPKFTWIYDFLKNDKFLKELKIYIYTLKKELEYKNSQKHFFDKLKKKDKEFRKKLKENKQKKEKPTLKQIYCYNKLCEKHKIDKENLNGLSKFDLVNKISQLKKLEV